MFKLKKGEVVLVDSVPDCIFCSMNGQPGVPGPYDFASRQGPWGNGCEKHWEQLRAAPGLGTGKAQLWVTEDQVDRDDEPKPGTVGAVLKAKKDRERNDIRSELASIGLMDDEVEAMMDDFGLLS